MDRSEVCTGCAPGGYTVPVACTGILETPVSGGAGFNVQNPLGISCSILGPARRIGTYRVR